MSRSVQGIKIMDRVDGEIKNATIAATTLGVDAGHAGCMSARLLLDYGDGKGSQTFGGFVFDDPQEAPHRVGSAFGCEYIRALMEAVGVRQWEDLVGTKVRVFGTREKIRRVGHIVEDKWFDPKVLAATMGLDT